MEEQRWQSAIDNAREYLEIYKSIPTGFLGAILISDNIRRYEDGERTPELLETLEGVR